MSDTSPLREGQVDHSLVPSPLYVNIENSRRFRALPLFASLLSLGKEGYRGTPISAPRVLRELMNRYHHAKHHFLKGDRYLSGRVTLVRATESVISDNSRSRPRSDRTHEHCPLPRIISIRVPTIRPRLRCQIGSSHQRHQKDVCHRYKVAWAKCSQVGC